jgi:peptidoglycan hydrolase-like protein with peptidoglycan-binding domain
MPTIKADMAPFEAPAFGGPWSIGGAIRWGKSGEPVAFATVRLFASSLSAPLGEGVTDGQGAFTIRFAFGAVEELDQRTHEVYLVVADAEGHILLDTHETPLQLMSKTWEVELTVPGDAADVGFLGAAARPTVQVGPMELDAEAVAEAKPEVVLDIARLLVGQEVDAAALKKIEALSPELLPARSAQRTLSTTPILMTIEALIALKGWPREVALEVDRILQMDQFGFFHSPYLTPNFSITYQTEGPAAPNPSTAAEQVFEPGAVPPQPIGTLLQDEHPTYVRRVGFWLERALAIYIQPPFSMRNPAAGGRIPVVINSAPFGGANPTTFYINNQLPPDIICAVAVHELFHMVQFKYAGNGPWKYSMMEGGAVVAEDAVADRMNRYLDEAGVNFNGVGVLANPALSLINAGYKASLFWRYVAEQQSPDIADPIIGAETYRALIEQCALGSWSTDDIRAAIRKLPYYADFYEFAFLDPARLDRTSSETIFGNYALACYLKELGANVPDRRFDFMEDEEDIRIDDILKPMIPSIQLQATLAPVKLAGTGTVKPVAAAAFVGQVNSFAHCFYEVAVEPAVTNVDVRFKGSAGLTSAIFQVALIDQDNRVRDIIRTDARDFAKRLTNLIADKRLRRIGLVVSGANSSGSFSLSVSPAPPAPDVMITRWHSAQKTEYEIDSRNWAWTWVSPDVWVDNDGNGVADSLVFFNYNNKLHIRLHNKGNAAAQGIQVQLWYQNAAAGLSPGGWIPVRNKAGVVQVLTGLTLPPGTSKDWVVRWSPTPAAGSTHFCIRVVVTAPGDPNTDNKRALSNFGVVRIRPLGRIDLPILRANPFPIPRPITLRVIPRLPSELRLSPRDLQRETVVLQPGESVHEALRVEHRRIVAPPGGVVPPPILRPDPLAMYPTDARALPPGIAGRPMITVVNEVEGALIGGFTFLVGFEGEPPPDEARDMPAR